MEKLIFISLVFTITLMNCTTDTTRKIESAEELKIGQLDSKNPGSKILEESGYLDIKLNSSDESWRDINNLYRNSVESEEDSPALTNFKRSVIKDLVLKYDLLNIVDNEKISLIEFYSNEIYQTDGLSLPECSFRLLSELSNYWDQSKINKYALDAIEKGSIQEKRLKRAIHNLSLEKDPLKESVVMNLKETLSTHLENISKLKTFTENTPVSTSEVEG